MATTLYVFTDAAAATAAGKDVYYTSIQAAVNAADSGDIIEIAAGTYYDDVTLREDAVTGGAKALTFKGVGEVYVTGQVAISTSGSATWQVETTFENITFKQRITDNTVSGGVVIGRGSTGQWLTAFTKCNFEGVGLTKTNVLSIPSGANGAESKYVGCTFSNSKLTTNGNEEFDTCTFVNASINDPSGSLNVKNSTFSVEFTEDMVAKDFYMIRGDVGSLLKNIENSTFDFNNPKNLTPDDGIHWTCAWARANGEGSLDLADCTITGADNIEIFCDAEKKSGTSSFSAVNLSADVDDLAAAVSGIANVMIYNTSADGNSVTLIVTDAAGAATKRTIPTATIYVDSKYDGEFGTDLGDDKYFGINAFDNFESALAAAEGNAAVTRIEIQSDIMQNTFANPGTTYDITQNLTIAATEGKNFTVTLSRDKGKTYSIYQRENNSSVTIAENLTIEGLDIVADGFATTDNELIIDGDVKLLSLKVWTSNNGITVNTTGSVWMGYGDGQLDLAYGNGFLTVNGTLTDTDILPDKPQFQAGYSGTRGSGNTVNLNNTYFEAGAWFTINGSNGTINVDNSVLKVSGEEGLKIASSGNVINVDNDSRLIVSSITVAEKNVIEVNNSSLEVGTVTNNGTITVSGASTINGGSDENGDAKAAKFTGSGWVYMKSAKLDADTNIQGANIRFVEGESVIDGATINPTGKYFQVGAGHYITDHDNPNKEAELDRENDVTVIVKNNAYIDGGSAEGYGTWVGTEYYENNNEAKVSNMTAARYTLDIQNSLAVFDTIHVSNDGILKVTGRSERVIKNEHTWWDGVQQDVNFYTGTVANYNGLVILDNTNAWSVAGVNISGDNTSTGDAAGRLIIQNKAVYRFHQDGDSNVTSLNIKNYGSVTVNNSVLEMEDGTISIATDAVLNVEDSANVYAAKGVKNDGMIKVDGKSLVSAKSITGNGSIEIDATGFSGVRKVVDVEADGMEISDITVKNNAAAKFVQNEEGDIILVNVDGSNVVVNAAWTSQADVDAALSNPSEITGVYFGGNAFNKLADAVAAVEDNGTVALSDSADAIISGGEVSGKTVTITGEALVEWEKDAGTLLVGRVAAGTAENGKLIFDDAKITAGSMPGNAAHGIHVSGAKKDSATTKDGELVIQGDSQIELSYLINRNNVEVIGTGEVGEKANLDIGNLYVHGRNAAESDSQTDETATMTVSNGAWVNFRFNNGMGIGGESDGILTLKGDSKFTAENNLYINNNGTLNVEDSTLIVKKTLSALDGSAAGTVTVSSSEGKSSTLQIAALTGSVDVQAGTTLKDTSVAGTVKLNEGVTYFDGTNYIKAVDNSVAGFDLVVNKGASLKIGRYTLGYNRDLTVNGMLEDATEWAPDADTVASLDVDSSSGFSIGGWGTSVLTVNDAYVNLKGSTWKEAQGQYTWNFDNSYVAATTFGNTNAKLADDARWDITFADSKLAAASYIKAGYGTNIYFTEGSVANTGSMAIRGSLSIDETSSVKATAQQNNGAPGVLDGHGDIFGTVNVSGKLDITGNGMDVIGGDLNIDGGTVTADLGKGALLNGGNVTVANGGTLTGKDGGVLNIDSGWGLNLVLPINISAKRDIGIVITNKKGIEVINKTYSLEKNAVEIAEVFKDMEEGEYTIQITDGDTVTTETINLVNGVTSIVGKDNKVNALLSGNGNLVFDNAVIDDKIAVSGSQKAVHFVGTTSIEDATVLENVDAESYYIGTYQGIVDAANSVLNVNTDTDLNGNAFIGYAGYGKDYTATLNVAAGKTISAGGFYIRESAAINLGKGATLKTGYINLKNTEWAVTNANIVVTGAIISEGTIALDNSTAVFGRIDDKSNNVNDFTLKNNSVLSIAGPHYDPAKVAMDYTSTYAVGAQQSELTVISVTVDWTGWSDEAADGDTYANKLIDMNAKYDVETGKFVTAGYKVTADETVYKAMIGEANWNENFVVLNNDLYITDADKSTLYVSDEYAKAELGDIVDGKIVGYNAFADINAAFRSAVANGGATITSINGSDFKIGESSYTYNGTVGEGIVRVGLEASGKEFIITGETSGDNSIALEMRGAEKESLTVVDGKVATVKIQNAEMAFYKLSAYNNSKIEIVDSVIDMRVYNKGSLFISGPLQTEDSGQLLIKNSTILNNIQISAWGQLFQVDNSTLNAGTASSVQGKMEVINNSTYSVINVGISNGGSLVIDNSKMIRKEAIFGTENQNDQVAAGTEYVVYVGWSENVGCGQFVKTNTAGSLTVQNGATFDFSKALYEGKAGANTDDSKVIVSKDSTITVDGSKAAVTFTADQVTNNGIFTVFGESTVKVDKLVGSITLGSTEKDTEITADIKGGNAKVYITDGSTVTLKGNLETSGTVNNSVWNYSDGSDQDDDKDYSGYNLEIAEDANIRVGAIYVSGKSVLTVKDGAKFDVSYNSGTSRDGTLNIYGSTMTVEDGATVDTVTNNITGDLTVYGDYKATKLLVLAGREADAENAGLRSGYVLVDGGKVDMTGNGNLLIGVDKTASDSKKYAELKDGDKFKATVDITNKATVSVADFVNEGNGGFGQGWVDVYANGVMNVSDSTLEIGYGINNAGTVTVTDGIIRSIKNEWTKDDATVINNSGDFTVNGASTVVVDEFYGNMTFGADAVLSNDSKIDFAGDDDTVTVKGGLTFQWNDVTGVENWEAAEGAKININDVILPGEDASVVLLSDSDNDVAASQLVINGSNIVDGKIVSNGKVYEVVNTNGEWTIKQYVAPTPEEPAYTPMTLFADVEQGKNADADGKYTFTIDAHAENGTGTYSYKYFVNGEEITGNTFTAAYGENLIVKVVAADAFGASTEVSSNIKVTVEDYTDPVLSLNTNGYVSGAWSQKAVTLNASATDIDNNGAKVMFSTDNGSSWAEFDGSVTLSDGEYEYWFKALDNANHESAVEKVNVKVDSIAPTMKLTASTDKATNADVVLSAVISDGTVEYFDGTGWVEGDKLTVSKNGTYQFRVTDAAGNVTTREYTVNNIDKVAPVAPVASADETNATNGNVTVSATFSADSVKKEYSKDGGETWDIYVSSGVTFETNGTVQFRATDAAGNVSAISEYTVSNIDKVDPAFGDVKFELVGDHVEASWSVADMGGSEIAEVLLFVDGIKVDDVTGETAYKFESGVFGKFELIARDNAGNVVSASKVIDLGGSDSGDTDAKPEPAKKINITAKTSDEEINDLAESYVIMAAGKSDIKIQSGSAKEPAKVTAQGFGKTAAEGEKTANDINNVTVGNYTELKVLDNIANAGNIKVGNNAVIRVLADNENATLKGVDANQTFQAGKNSVFAVNGHVDLGKGNDTIKTGANTVFSANDLTLGEGNDKITTGKAGQTFAAAIDFGEGKNTLQIGNDAEFSAESVKFGDGNGNDTFKAGNGADVDITGAVSFGAGKNTLQLGKDAWFSAESVKFGMGNDTFKAGNGADVDITGDVNFGEGKNTLQLGNNAWFSAESVKFGTGNGNDTLQIGKKSMFYTDDITFGAGNDKFIIGDNTEVEVFGALDMGDGKDTLTIKKDATLTLWTESLTGVETINASKGAELWTDKQVDFTGVKGSWKNLEIFENLDKLGTGELYGNEHDMLFDVSGSIVIDKVVSEASIMVEFSVDGIVWDEIEIGKEYEFSNATLRISATDLAYNEKKEYTISTTTIA